MIHLEPAGTRIVKPVHDEVVQRSGEQDVAIGSGEGNVGGPAQCLAFPVMSEQFQVARLQVKDVNRIWPVTCNPNPTLLIKSDSIWDGLGHSPEVLFQSLFEDV